MAACNLWFPSRRRRALEPIGRRREGTEAERLPIPVGATRAWWVRARGIILCRTVVPPLPPFWASNPRGVRGAFLGLGSARNHAGFCEKRSLSGKQDQDGQRRRLEKEATRLLTGRPVKRIGKRKAKR